ncbi:MAG: AAA family ATPase [Oscillospiraceae bacterium]|nr:AAA family ATPase [Oscillospiraceae bacterium]
MAKIILAASGKGGAGKSTVSALLGEALASKKHKTLIIELDSGLRSLDVALGVTENIVFDLGDIIRGSCDMKDALAPCPFCEGLSLIPAAAKPAVITAGAINDISSALGEEYEYIILDCPAGIGEALENAAKCADLALVVATPDPSSVRGARSAGALLANCGVKNRRLVIERCPQKAKKLSPINNLDEIIDGAELQLIGVIWEDPLTRSAMDSGAPLSYESPNYQTFRNLSERICGKNIPLGFK